VLYNTGKYKLNIIRMLIGIEIKGEMLVCSRKKEDELNKGIRAKYKMDAIKNPGSCKNLIEILTKEMMHNFKESRMSEFNENEDVILI